MIFILNSKSELGLENTMDLEDLAKSYGAEGRASFNNCEPLQKYCCAVPIELNELVAIAVLNLAGEVVTILGMEKLKVRSKSISNNSPYQRCPPPTNEIKSFS